MKRWLFFRKTQTPPDGEALPHGMEFKRKELSFDEIHDQWEGLRRRLGEEPTPSAVVRPLRVYWYAAAAVAALTVLGWWVYRLNAYVHHETAYGHVASVRLPEGSEVILNGNSTLRYRRDWVSGQTREVWLEGEAFFRVRRQPGRTKFLVHSGEVRVEVLGTAFNVVTRRGQTRVVLESGRVKLLDAGRPGQLVFMKPNDLVEFRHDRQFRKQTVQPRQHLAWQQHKMVFDDTPMREVAERLGDVYGLEVVFADGALAGRKLTGEISARNVDVLLSAMSVLLDAEVQREGRRVLLKHAAGEGP